MKKNRKPEFILTFLKAPNFYEQSAGRQKKNNLLNLGYSSAKKYENQTMLVRITISPPFSLPPQLLLEVS